MRTQEAVRNSHGARNIVIKEYFQAACFVGAHMHSKQGGLVYWWLRIFFFTLNRYMYVCVGLSYTVFQTIATPQYNY